MAYTPTTDFVGIIRYDGSLYTNGRMPSMDFVITSFAASGVISMTTAVSAPTSNQATTAWLDPASPSYGGTGTLKLWNRTNTAYEVATPILFAALLTSQSHPATTHYTYKHAADSLEPTTAEHTTPVAGETAMIVNIATNQFKMYYHNGTIWNALTAA